MSNLPPNAYRADLPPWPGNCTHCDGTGIAEPAQTTRVEEYAQLFSGGSMLVRNDHPEVERIFPLTEWIKASTQGGGKVYRRTVIVVEDWQEVTR